MAVQRKVRKVKASLAPPTLAHRASSKRKFVQSETQWAYDLPITATSADPLRFVSQGHLGTTEQRFDNYGKLIDRVVEVFGDEIAASKWLSTPSADFEQKTPLEIARANGYQVTALEPLLIRIEHGVYF